MLLRKRAEPRDTDEDEKDSVQDLLLGDSGGGAELDKRGPQHAQRGRKQGKCGVQMIYASNVRFLLLYSYC